MVLWNVKFKPISGKEDQAAELSGDAGRGQYYVCPRQSLEDNVTIYPHHMGKRTKKRVG